MKQKLNILQEIRFKEVIIDQSENSIHVEENWYDGIITKINESTAEVLFIYDNECSFREISLLNIEVKDKA